jgi:pimeloyl-ACP methyl ester carboxylesterase
MAHGYRLYDITSANDWQCNLEIYMKIKFAIILLVFSLCGEFTLGQDKPAKPSGMEQVTELKAVHRQGQTFLTWKEADSPAKDDTLSMAKYRGLLKEWRTKVRYRVYRSEKPITSVQGLTAVGETGPLSCWNGSFPSDMTPKDTDLTPRYVIGDGKAPLATGTGLYVHNPAAAGKAFYAVTLVLDGKEDPIVTADSVLKEPVDEKPGQGVPVLQSVRELKASEHFNFVNGPLTIRKYVRWEAPPHANRENFPNNFVVAIPPTKPTSIGLHLHCWGGSPMGGYGWWYNAEKGSILIAADQVPYDWWTGYHELYGKGERSSAAWSKGVVRPYTQTRLLSLLDWAATQWKVEMSQTFVAGNSMGGSGTPMMAIRHPDRFAWAISWVGVHVPAKSPGFKTSYAAVFGDPEWGVKFEDGTPVWDYFNDDWYLRTYPERDTPFITWANGKNDAGIGWAQAVDFLKAMQETKRPHLFVWGQNGHRERAAMPLSNEQRVMPLDLRVDQSQPAFTKCSLDGNPGDGDPNDGDKQGGVNLYLTWQTKDIVDEDKVWEMTVLLTNKAPQEKCTVDLTPRRLQKFKVKPGEAVKWTSTSGSNNESQSGTVTADKHGLITIEGLKLTKTGVRVRIAR